jgi:hypothetical protein
MINFFGRYWIKPAKQKVLKSKFENEYCKDFLHHNQSVYPLAKIAADFNSATFKSIKQHFGEHKFVNFLLKFVD